jgi:selenocysteine lyase/cysteine desulfurase
MWGRQALLETLSSQGHYFNEDKPRYRMNPAGPLHAEIAAMAGIGAYIAAIHAHHFNDPDVGAHDRAARVFDLFAEHEARLANRVLDTLKTLPGARIIGRDHAEPGQRAATISVVLDGIKHSEAVRRLAARQIAVRNGHFYALRCVEALGIADPEEGVIRISIVHYNTEAEVERLVDGLKSL